VVLPELHKLFERVTLQSKRGKDPFASTGSYQYDVLEVELLLIACSVWSGMTVERNEVEGSRNGRIKNGLDAGRGRGLEDDP
jgi:hypothetical protein